jgi:hypothetical protein
MQGQHLPGQLLGLGSCCRHHRDFHQAGIQRPDAACCRALQRACPLCSLQLFTSCTQLLGMM